MDNCLRCQVTPGMFSGEVAVRGTTADGTEFSLFVSEEFVDCSEPVTEGRPVDGWLSVEVLAREDNLALVRLPGQTFENGQTVTVLDSQLELRPRRQTA